MCVDVFTIEIRAGNILVYLGLVFFSLQNQIKATSFATKSFFENDVK